MYTYTYKSERIEFSFILAFFVHFELKKQMDASIALRLIAFNSICYCLPICILSIIHLSSAFIFALLIASIIIFLNIHKYTLFVVAFVPFKLLLILMVVSVTQRRCGVRSYLYAKYTKVTCRFVSQKTQLYV